MFFSSIFIDGLSTETVQTYISVHGDFCFLESYRVSDNKLVDKSFLSSNDALRIWSTYCSEESDERA